MANLRVVDKPSTRLEMSPRSFGLFTRDKTTQTEIRAVSSHFPSALRCSFSTQRVSGPHEASGHSALPFQFICCRTNWDFKMASREQA
jgi:hypothetical protein